VTLGGIGDDLRQRGLACAWRSLQNNELKKFVGFDGAAQKFAFTYNMFLSDVFISVRRHIRAASGASLFRRSCMAWSKRSLDIE
jgi:hypothetical protein